MESNVLWICAYLFTICYICYKYFVCHTVASLEKNSLPWILAIYVGNWANIFECYVFINAYRRWKDKMQYKLEITQIFYIAALLTFMNCMVFNCIKKTHWKALCINTAFFVLWIECFKRIYRVLSESFERANRYIKIQYVFERYVEKTNDTCAICHDSFKDPIQLTCAHVFCSKCITQWVQTSKILKCPYCRTTHSNYVIK